VIQSIDKALVQIRSIQSERKMLLRYAKKMTFKELVEKKVLISLIVVSKYLMGKSWLQSWLNHEKYGLIMKNIYIILGQDQNDLMH